MEGLILLSEMSVPDTQEKRTPPAEGGVQESSGRGGFSESKN